MLTKIVNGIEVEMPPQEEAAIRAEWAANAAQVPVRMVSAQDLIGQFTATDVAMIRIAIDNEAAQAKSDFAESKVPLAPLNHLWAALQTQKDPMHPANARFRAGWSALVGVLGQARMDAIAAALGVTV